MPTATSSFRRLSLLALVAVYFLVFVGGLVRSTGSGMGCPDWPKCFGRFIPPTDVSELPADYKEFYSAYRSKKNERFIRMLEGVGMDETASALRSDPAILEEADFNAVKTWIEYINRLIGAVVGLLLTLLLVFSFRQPSALRWWSGAAWLLVVVTGWFGSIVVSTNLTAWTVTIHLGLAMAIILCLVAVRLKSRGAEITASKADRRLIGLLLVLLLIQFFLGTEVRSAIDRVSALQLDRMTWIPAAGIIFIVHRTFSWVVMAMVVFLVWRFRKKGLVKVLYPLVGVILSLVFSGAVLGYLGLPWLVQPLHLLLACLAFGELSGLLLVPGVSPDEKTL